MSEEEVLYWIQYLYGDYARATLDTMPAEEIKVTAQEIKMKALSTVFDYTELVISCEHEDVDWKKVQILVKKMLPEYLIDLDAFKGNRCIEVVACKDRVIIHRKDGFTRRAGDSSNKCEGIGFIEHTLGPIVRRLEHVFFNTPVEKYSYKFVWRWGNLTLKK